MEAVCAEDRRNELEAKRPCQCCPDFSDFEVARLDERTNTIIEIVDRIEAVFDLKSQVIHKTE